MAKQHVVVIGGGLAGLSATMRLAEAGIHVYLISLVPVKRSHSVCAQGGINSVNDLTRQQGDDEWKHFDDTVYGGDFLQHQPPVKEMCDWGPRVINLMDRLGVTFNRTPEGYRDQRRFGGTLYKRTAFAGATTGQQLIYALDEQVRHWESRGLVDKYEYWDYLGPIIDENGRCRGVVAQDLFSMKIRSFAGDAVVIATGGGGLVFGRTTMSTVCTGSAAAKTYRAGVRYANGEFVQVHPTTVPGTDKLRLMSESARGEGGRVWVPRKPGDTRDPLQIPSDERYYFLEERYPKFGNLVPRDIATREIFRVCVDEGLSVEKGAMCVYLDLTDLPSETHRKLEGILETYEKFQGEDPRQVPMKIFPGVHYFMGGLWCDYEKDERTGGLVMGSVRNQHSNIDGLFVIGEADYQYHGANRLGANSLLSCIFTGLIVGPTVDNYIANLTDGSAEGVPVSLFDGQVKRHEQEVDELANRTGGENPYIIHQELGEICTRACTVVRKNSELEAALTKIDELDERYQRIEIVDRGHWSNQNLVYARNVGDMLTLARVIAQGALQRDECRGAHYKPEFDIPAPDADEPVELRRQVTDWCKAFQKKNEQWLKTTIAEHTPEGPKFSYEPVDVSLIPPRPRTYGLKGAEVIDQVWPEEFVRGKEESAVSAGL